LIRLKSLKVFSSLTSTEINKLAPYY
jgi:hypothetical protein